MHDEGWSAKWYCIGVGRLQQLIMLPRPLLHPLLHSLSP